MLGLFQEDSLMRCIYFIIIERYKVNKYKDIMESIDTSSQPAASSSDPIFRPKFLLIEANVPGIGHEFIPIRNYNPRLLPAPKDKKAEKRDQSDDEVDEEKAEAAKYRNSHVYIPKFNKFNFDRVKRKDLLFHTQHGYLKVVLVNHLDDDDTKAVISFQTKVLDAKGKKTDEAVEFTLDQAKLCKEFKTRFKVDVKVFLPTNEAITAQLDIPVKRNVLVQDVIRRIEDLTNVQYMVFVDGQLVDKKAKIQAAFKKDSKVLLYNQMGGVNRPDGIRSWFRFPKSNITEESVCRSDEQSVVYVPIQDNVEIHGFMIYRHTNESIEYMEVRMKIRIHDENDTESNIVWEKSFETMEVRYDQVKWDNNKMASYNFVEKHQLEPVKVKLGQHMHLTQSYYHRSSTERFHFGEDGDKFDTVQNMDSDVFIIKPSRYYSDSTTVEKGQLPGLLFKFTPE